MRGEQGQSFVYQSSDTGYNKHNNVVKSKSVESAFWEHITKQRVGARGHFTIEYVRCCFPSPYPSACCNFAHVPTAQLVWYMFWR